MRALRDPPSRSGRTKRVAFWFFLSTGFFVVALLVAVWGGARVLEQMRAVGWGLAWVAAWRVVSLGVYAASWRRLVARAHRPPFVHALWMRWIGESVNTLLPVAQVGGDIARARLLVRNRVPLGGAAAATIADLAVGAGTQAVFTLAGLAALVARGMTGSLRSAASAGAVLLVIGNGLLYWAFRTRHRLAPLVRSLARRFAPAWLAAHGDVDESLQAISRRDVFESALLHLAGWFTHVGETWLTLFFLGRTASLLEALIIESLSSAARGAAFVVPGGIGVQEPALVAAAVPLGIGVSTALALGVVKRARELVVGLPGLAAWSLAERRGLAQLQPEEESSA